MLDLRQYEWVKTVMGEDGNFSITATDRSGRPHDYRTKKVIVSTGYYDLANQLRIPGEDLPKVSHYYGEPHPYYDTEVLVIGGKNSAAIAALDLWRHGARVTLVHREAQIHHHVKYWIKPDIENRIKNRQDRGLLQQLGAGNWNRPRDDQHAARPVRLKNDFVLALIGYHPDYDFLRSMGIELSERAAPPGLRSGVSRKQCPGNLCGRRDRRGVAHQRNLHRERPLPRQTDCRRPEAQAVSLAALRAQYSRPAPPPCRVSTRMDPQPERVATSITIASYVRLVRGNRNFRRLWLAQIVSEIGDWFYTLSIYTLLLQLTGAAGSVALALVLQVLPQTLVGPMAGVVNDRLKRKHVMIAADLGRCIVVLAMLFVRSRSMVWLIYPLLVSGDDDGGVLRACPQLGDSEYRIRRRSAGGQYTFVGNMVREPTDWRRGRRRRCRILGREVVFGLNALSFLVSAVLIGGMRFAEPHADPAAPLRPRDLVDFSPVVEGIRYIRSHPTLFPAVFAKAGELMIGPSWVIFTVMGRESSRFMATASMPREGPCSA